MMHGRRTAAMAVACLLCMAVALLLAQGVQSRKLLWTGREGREEQDDLGSLGSSHGAAGTAATPEPCGRGSPGSAGTGGEAVCETARWEEIHTDYIYTQDVVKHP